MIKKIIASMLILLTGYMIFVSGCVDEPNSKELNLSLEEVSAKMQEKENSINDSSYTMLVTMYSEGEKIQENEFNITCKKPNMKKTVAKQEGKETLMVYDGNVEWNYDPQKNTVQKIIISDEYYQKFDIDYLQFFNDILNEYNVTVLGTEMIDGRKAYLLEAKPKETLGDTQDDTLDRMKIWIDNENWILLKYEIYAGTQKVQIEIRNLKFNTGIPDSEFRFDVPEGANVTTMNFEDIINKNMSKAEKMIPSEGKKDTVFAVIS